MSEMLEGFVFFGELKVDLRHSALGTAQNKLYFVLGSYGVTLSAGAAFPMSPAPGWAGVTLAGCSVRRGESMEELVHQDKKQLPITQAPEM